MQPQLTARINPWFAFKASGARSYIAGSVIVLTLSAVLSFYTQSWSWISRAGGVIVLFGVLLSLRRLFRLGPQNYDEPTEPAVVNGTQSNPKYVQFNFKYMHQSIQRLTDSFAQTSGISLMILGTVLASYGDVILDYLVPLK